MEWIAFSIHFGKLSKAIKLNNKSQIKYHLVHLMSMIFLISRSLNLNMDNAWNNWIIKANAKHYS